MHQILLGCDVECNSTERVVSLTWSRVDVTALSPALPRELTTPMLPANSVRTHRADVFLRQPTLYSPALGSQLQVKMLQSLM